MSSKTKFYLSSISAISFVRTLEEENEFEVDWYFLQLWSQRRDRDELGDVEEEGDDDHREHVSRHRLGLVVVSLLK